MIDTQVPVTVRISVPGTRMEPSLLHVRSVASEFQYISLHRKKPLDACIFVALLGERYGGISSDDPKRNPLTFLRRSGRDSRRNTVRARFC